MSKSNQNKQKGQALETAVRFIQETLLSSDPKLKGVEFTIETNKLVFISGVRHEIDILVKTLPGSPYEATIIFECKNRKAAANKNDVMLLSAKVNALGASKGVLVAGRLTRDGQNQIKLDLRLSFTVFTQDFVSPLNDLRLVHAVHDLEPIKLHIKQRGVPPVDNPPPTQWRQKVFRLNGTKIELPAFIKQHVDQLIVEDRKENSYRNQPDGTYPGGQALEIVFDPKEFTMDDSEVERMVVEVRFNITIRRRKIVSKFELAGIGRSYSFEPLEEVIPGKKLEVNVVELIRRQLDNPSTPPRI